VISVGDVTSFSVGDILSYVCESPAASGATSPPRLTDFVLLPLLYFVSAKLGVVLSVMPEGMAILWPPNGVVLAYFIRFGPRYYLPFGVLALLAELAVDMPRYSAGDALLFGFANVTEVTVASLLLARVQFNPRFAQPSDLAKFVVAAPVTGAFVGAVLGAFVFSKLPGSDTVYFQFLRIWWFGDALGLMIVTPLFLSAWAQTRNLPLRLPTLKPRDAVIGLGALAVIGLLLASRDGTLMGTHIGPVLLLPFAIFAGVRFGPSAAAVTVSGVAILILVMTTQGRNPFGADAPRDAVIHAQEFVLVLSVMTLGMASLMSHVRAGQAELEVANQELHSRVKQLRGLLPICAWCKRVRDDHDYWHSVEEYIAERTDAQFSHGICPDCVREVEPRTAEALEGTRPS
jgi:integral membrane sensor domain MASE1